MENYTKNIEFGLSYSPNYTQFEFTKENTFVIGLDQKSDRMVIFDKRMKRLKVEYTYQKASTPQTLTDVFWKSLSSTEKACSQSHLNVYKHIVTNELDYALIFEDDACLDLNWEKKLNQLKKNNWDFIMLNASEKTDKDCWVVAKEQYMAAAYIISNIGAKRILDTFKGNFATSDWMITRIQLLGNSYTYFPWLAIQEYKSSSIQTDEHMKADYEKMTRLLASVDYKLTNYY